MTVLAAIALLCWASACLRQRAVRITWTPLYVPAMACLALPLLQLIAHRTQDPVATRESLIKLAGYLLIFFLTVNLFAEAPRGTWKVLGGTVTAYMYSIAVFAIVQFFSSPDRLYWTVKPRWPGYMFGPYVSHNHYAGLMEMLIPIAAVCFLKADSQRYLVGFGLLIALVSVVLCGSRGGAFALIVEIALLALVVWRARPSRDKLIATVALFVVMTVITVWLIPANVSQRLSTTIHSPDVAYGARKNMSMDSLRMFRDHPVLGVGLGSFEAAYPKYQSFASDLLIDYAHSDYLQFLAETGILGAGVAMAALAIFGARLLRLWQSGVHSTASFMQLGACLACIGLLVHSWVDFNLHIPANAAWFAFLAGITQVNAGRKPQLSNHSWTNDSC